jgi:hypothetical protein
MIENTGLENLCHVHDSAEEIKQALKKLMDEPFTEEDVLKRREVLGSCIPIKPPVRGSWTCYSQ